MSRKSRLVWLLGVTFLALVLDQASKIYAMNWLTQTANDPISCLADTLRVQYAHNDGAFLSLMSSLSNDVRFWVLTVINGVVLIGLAVYLLLAREVTAANFVPLMLVVAGGLGNLIDRIRFGYVIDFLNVGIGGLRTGIFNIADMFITAGFIVMAVVLIRGEKEQAAVKKTLNSHESPDPVHVPREGQI